MEKENPLHTIRHKGVYVKLPVYFEALPENPRQVWEETRRQEILDLFSSEIYGRTPTTVVEQKVTCVETKKIQLSSGRIAVYEELRFDFSKASQTVSMKVELYRPATTETQCGAVLLLDPFSKNSKVNQINRLDGQFPFSLILEHNMIAVRALVDDIAEDSPKTYYDDGMALLWPEGQGQWGAVSAWSWAGSRVIDYLVDCPEINPQQIAVCGFSRGGKASLWCGAQDQRVAITFSASSGCTGAAITRGKKGEKIQDITAAFPHWFAQQYAGYSGKEENLPIDQHLLVGLIAPRGLYISSSSLDEWADPEKEFASLGEGNEIHKLYEKQTIERDEPFPPVDTPITTESMGYHVRTGEHKLTPQDWKFYLKFMETMDTRE